MSHGSKINLTSLSLVHDELVNSIEQAAAKLEEFVAQLNDGELLQACIEGMQQISGTLSLVQLHGADILAKEILALLNDITIGDEGIEARLSAVTNAFFIVPRYIEYTLQTRRGMPVLLIPVINELRLVRHEKPLQESYFFDVDLTRGRKLAGQGSSVLSEDLTAVVRRLRHMYQVGLVSVLRGKLVKPSLGMMQRAMQRLASVSGNRPLGTLWHVTATALGAMAEQGMEINKERKMLFGAVDRQIKRLQQDGQKALDQEAPKLIVKDCVYLIAASGSDAHAVKTLKQVFAFEPLNYVDNDLVREREVLRGPSATTVNSVAAVLKDELNAIKEVLERASQSGVEGITDFDELTGNLEKVAEILGVVGLIAPSNALKDEIKKVKLWRDRPESVDAKAMIDLADVVLYVESTIIGLEMSNLSAEKLSKANSIARKDIIASSQLAEAEMVVLKEAESGLSLIKRALNSFAESNYDRGHIKNVAATLTSVRGGMAVLSLTRASKVVGACAEFVEDTLLHNDQPAALQHLLETFADAVIGLEYYLDAVKTDKNAGDDVLEVAEESLEALGHPVR